MFFLNKSFYSKSNLRYFFPLSLGLFFLACNSWIPEENALATRTTETQETANCASCHTYPVGGVNHQYHLLHTDKMKPGNGKITCLDCHYNSLQSRDVKIMDSIFMDTVNQVNNSYSTYDFGDNTQFRNSILQGAYVFHHVDTLIEHHPIPVPYNSRSTLMQEWITSMAHLNGTVDVKFDPRYTDLKRFNDTAATFNPKMETCSAVACHPTGGAWAWPAPSKKIKGFKGEEPAI